MVSRKGIKAAVEHDLGVAGHDVKVAGGKAEGAAKVAGRDVKVAGGRAENALKTAGRDVKKAGQKVRKRL